MKRLTLIATLILSACTCLGAGGYKVALVLPFDTRGGGSVNYFDFYCGAFLAADSLCQQGYDITIKVVDCSRWAEGDTTHYKSLEGANLIIGPVSAGQQKTLQEYSISREVPIVSPLDVKCSAFAETNPYFFSVPAERITQVNNMVEAIAADGEGDIVIFYNQANTSDMAYDELIENALTRAGLTFSRRSYGILQGRVITEKLKKEMAGGHHKKVIIASEDEAFASDVVRNMALVELDGTSLSLYGSNRLRSFETIEAATLYQLNYHFSTPFFVDYKDETTRNFVLNYRELFNTEPTPYAFQGYDILYYFVTVMEELGESFMDFVPYYPKSLLQNNFKFWRTDDESGLTNIGTRDVRFLPDHSIQTTSEF